MRSLVLPLLLTPLAAAPAAAQDLHWHKSGFDWAGAVDLSVDVDGDGLADAIVGDPLAGSGGVVTVFSGASGAVVHTIVGGTGSHYGENVVGLSDLNGDGRAEFGLGGSWDELQVRDGASGAILNSYTTGGLEARLASIGDVNGDGWDDAVSSNPETGPGIVRVLSGRYYADGTPPLILWEQAGSQTGGRFGEAITSIGDVDGDGVDEVVVGAPEESGVSGLFAYHGRIHCLSGATGASLWVKKWIATVSTWFGGSLAAAGDFNGDGVPDVVAGAPGNDAGGLDAGAAFVLSGVHGGFLVQHYPTQAGSLFGSCVAGVGDVDQDGTPDLLIGKEGVGCSIGEASFFSGATMSALLHFTGGGFLGAPGTLSGGVDATGDGQPDFLMASPGGGVGPGWAQLWKAECSGGHVSYCQSAPNSTGQSATLHVLGTTSISANAMTLEARKGPPGNPGIFFYGTTQLQTPFGDGYLCVGGATTRLEPAVFIDAFGFASITPDLTAFPFGSGPGSVGPGDTRNFQFWYRDPAMPGGSGWNLTNAQQVTFCF